MSFHPSRCLKIIREQLQDCSRAHVLDLAKVCNNNLQFLSQLNCKVYLSDIYDHLDLINSNQLQKLIISPDNTKFDLILCWDLLNYLTVPQLEILLQHLQRQSNENALLHFFIRDQANMPALPYTFRILENDNIQIDNQSNEETICPRHSLRKLKQLLMEFSSKQGSLLNNGLQEYIWIKNMSKGSRLDLLLS